MTAMTQKKAAFLKSTNCQQEPWPTWIRDFIKDPQDPDLTSELPHPIPSGKIMEPIRIKAPTLAVDSLVVRPPCFQWIEGKLMGNHGDSC